MGHELHARSCNCHLPVRQGLQAPEENRASREQSLVLVHPGSGEDELGFEFQNTRIQIYDLPKAKHSTFVEGGNDSVTESVCECIRHGMT